MGPNLFKKDNESNLNLKSSHHIKDYTDKELIAHIPEINNKLECTEGMLDDINFNTEVKKDLKEQKVLPVMNRKTIFVGILVSLARKRLKSR